jgi:hypothetical protein
MQSLIFNNESIVFYGENDERTRTFPAKSNYLGKIVDGRPVGQFTLTVDGITFNGIFDEVNHKYLGEFTFSQQDSFEKRRAIYKYYYISLKPTTFNNFDFLDHYLFSMHKRARIDPLNSQPSSKSFLSKPVPDDRPFTKQLRPLFDPAIINQLPEILPENILPKYLLDSILPENPYTPVIVQSVNPEIIEDPILVGKNFEEKSIRTEVDESTEIYNSDDSSYEIVAKRVALTLESKTDLNQAKEIIEEKSEQSENSLDPSGSGDYSLQKKISREEADYLQRKKMEETKWKFAQLQRAPREKIKLLYNYEEEQPFYPRKHKTLKDMVKYCKKCLEPQAAYLDSKTKKYIFDCRRCLTNLKRPANNH